MKIDCYLSQGCRSEEDLKTNIAVALENEGLKAEAHECSFCGDTSKSNQ